MKNPEYDPTELLKRAAKIGITTSNYHNFRILFAKGYEPRMHASLNSSISFHELRQALNQIPFKTSERMEGNIILGRNSGGITRYQSHYAPTHLLGVGATGVGKTVFLIFLLLQYLLIATGIWIFDFVKRELRGFKRLAGQVGFDVIVCRHEWLRINLLDPQGTDPSLYANVCAEFITLSLGLPPVAKHILKICIIHLYERFGLFNNRNAEPPILVELIDEVRHFEGNKPAKDAILIRLEALLSNKRQVFNVRHGFPVDKLAKKLIVWEFDSLEMSYQNLIVSYLVSMLFLHRVSNPSRELVIVALDEASRLYSKRAEAASEGPSYISTMTNVVRKMFIALFVFTQTCFDLSNSIIANSGLKILFRVGAAQDYEIFGRAMGLTSEQIQWCKTNLAEGNQVIKMGFGWQQPFLNKSPMIHIPEDVSDSEVRESVQPLLDLISTPAIPQLSLPVSCNRQQSDQRSQNLITDEEILLSQIKANPDITSATVHYKMAGLGTKRGTVTKQSLVSKNILKETLLESGRRGRAEMYLELVEDSVGRFGSCIHRYMCKKAQDWYNGQSCITEPEKSFNHNGQQIFVDLAVTWPDGKTEALEVETQDTERALENIKKNLALGFKVISVLTPNQKVRNAIKRRIVGELTPGDFSQIKFPPMSFYSKDLD